MNAHDDGPRFRGAWRLTALHEKVAHYYYSHCLFCSTYPITVISVAIFVALICCYPLSHLILSGNLPLQIWSRTPNITTGNLAPNDPFCYVQQVVLRTAVIPWEQNLTIGDAFRAPLYESFKLLDIVRNFEDSESAKTLGDVCLHVEATSRRSSGGLFPQYSCLVLSPANLWQQDVQQFAQDKSLLSTIFAHQDFQKGKPSNAEMLFGMQLKNTGVKRYPVRTRQRLIQYAVTLFYKKYDARFVEGLKQKILKTYPLHQNLHENNSVSFFDTLNNTVLVFYPEDINYYEFIPLLVSFIVMFVYYYFSVRKIDFLKSRFGLAFTAVMTVLLSLTMTMGICFFFGVSLSLQGKEIFPYMVVLVGLENVLVLTKSVLATPPHLDAKIRVAQGMAKEGWSITKNLLLEITILTFGLFTFVPAIQEFCLFAITGLICDFFLQMLFFSTVLGIDIRRMENEIEKTNPNARNSLYQSHVYYNRSYGGAVKATGMNRSKSHPRLTSFHAGVASNINPESEKKIPKRLRLVNVWARTRFFQRASMILMVIWIMMFVYKSGFIENYFLKNTQEHTQSDYLQENTSYSSINLLPLPGTKTEIGFTSTQNAHYFVHTQNYSDEVAKLKHADFAPWMKLSIEHWPSILRKYNISLSGRSVAILPTIHVSHIITPEQAVLIRNPEEKYNAKFQWHTLAAALDPIDFGEMEENNNKKGFTKTKPPLYPTSPMEILITTILCIISLTVLTYTLIVLYRCICSRNYAEWRASWFNERNDESGEPPVLLEVLPVVLEGHAQEIECLATDGFSVASSCLSGHLKVWDVNTGEQLGFIDRSSNLADMQKRQFANDETASDYGSGSPPSCDELLYTPPKLHRRINTNFSNAKLNTTTIENNRYDFNAYFNNVNCKCGRSSCENCGKLWLVRRSTRDGVAADDFDVGVPIWCLDYVDNLIVVGCANGQIEFWEGTTGKLKCIYDNTTGMGITSVKIVGSRVIVALLSGTLEFLQLQTFTHGKPIDWNFTCAYRRTHLRTGSAGSISDHKEFLQEENKEDFRCVRVATVKAHQQPIKCMDSEGGRVVTGSQDHTLKVFRLEDGSALYTLHGHCGPITTMFIDRVSPATAGSGSQDGMVCVWDLMTGACMYSLQAHNGSVTALTYSASYVISLGSDERLCVWERFQGHLLNTISVSGAYSNQVVMLTSHLVITARNGVLVVFDVRSGENVRTISLGHCPLVFVKQMIVLRDAILCDYGNQLRIVRFPLIAHKYD